MDIPRYRMIEQLRKVYTPGTRVCLDRMNDTQAPPIGTLGTVIGVDVVGSIMVSWDNGSILNVIYGEDRCHVVEEGAKKNGQKPGAKLSPASPPLWRSSGEDWRKNDR